MWNGTAEILKAKPTASSAIPITASVGGAPAPWTESATLICSSLVEPATAKMKAIP